MNDLIARLRAGLVEAADAIEQLQQRAEAAENAATFALRSASDAHSRAEAAEAELARVKKDAERYRWLRDDEGFAAIDWDANLRVPEMPLEWWETATGGDQLDAAIDAAMQGGKG